MDVEQAQNNAYAPQITRYNSYWVLSMYWLFVIALHKIIQLIFRTTLYERTIIMFYGAQSS